MKNLQDKIKEEIANPDTALRRDVLNVRLTIAVDELKKHGHIDQNTKIPSIRRSHLTEILELLEIASKNRSLSINRNNSSRASNAADNQVFRDALFDLLKIFSDEKQPTPTKLIELLEKHGGGSLRSDVSLISQVGYDLANANKDEGQRLSNRKIASTIQVKHPTVARRRATKKYKDYRSAFSSDEEFIGMFNDVLTLVLRL